MGAESIIVTLVILAALAWLVYRVAMPDPLDDDKPAAVPQPPPTADTKAITAESLTKVADKLEPLMDKLAHPGDALSNADFEKAVTALASDDFTVDQVRNYAQGANWILSCIGFEALARREDSAVALRPVRKGLKTIYAWPLHFALRFLDEKSQEPEIGRTLVCAQYWWANNAAIVEDLDKFITKRLDDGEQVVFGPEYFDLSSEARQALNSLVDALPEATGNAIRTAMKQQDSVAIDTKFMRSIGELMHVDQVTDPVFDTPQIENIEKDFGVEMRTESPRSLLIVGKPGVGKSAVRRLLTKKLLGEGWNVLKTSAANIIADKVYIGEIEGQAKKLSEKATVAKRVAIVVDRLAELSELGRTKRNDNSVLDYLWPHIENRKIFLIGEATPSSLQVLLRRHPSMATAMKVVKMEPCSEATSEHLAHELLDWLYDELPDDQRNEVVAEALQLSQQYLAHKSLPGSVLSLLRLAAVRSEQSDDDEPLGRIHVLGALSQVSGLPKDVLDERQRLDIDVLREAFTSRVIGQDEAVDCLVERIAMLKAGLTDPTRPVGVFLFAGPTGTGKTEIAKRLAELLFGSPEQMIRLDMSEYQNSDSAWRLIGQSDQDQATGSLVSRIREQPFSVVLLDEFEKAHTRIWDIFLQVFDDGRLTDSNGALADFRHAIIILTSNLGATISNKAGVGFTSTSGGFSPDDVMKTVNRTFRREFVNRLDDVIVFNPLSREVMRAILQKELRQALGRRGLRTKQWAVEWEDSAIEFLLNEGFTPDLGARPLRRAIERHLLAPLSITMVQNQAPEGEQFLFVRSNGEALQVEFIDPDADIDAQSHAREPMSNEQSLASLLLAGNNPVGAEDFLLADLDRVQDRIQSDEWHEAKTALIDEMNGDGFWQRDGRHAILDRIELMDRIDTAAKTLRSLGDRLMRTGANTRLVQSIAGRLYVLREGLKDLDEKRATQAVVGVRLVTNDARLRGAKEFRDDLVEMYQSWARSRGMRLTRLRSRNSRYEVLFLVSGFGSFGLLQPETGLHVLEVPADGNKFDRIRARVQVAPVPTSGPEVLRDIERNATALLDSDKTQKVVIVRRYRRDPSPLARDSVRGWRTGKLDQVLAGNFDLIS